VPAAAVDGRWRGSHRAVNQRRSPRARLPVVRWHWAHGSGNGVAIPCDKGPAADQSGTPPRAGDNALSCRDWSVARVLRADCGVAALAVSPLAAAPGADMFASSMSKGHEGAA